MSATLSLSLREEALSPSGGGRPKPGEAPPPRTEGGTHERSEPSASLSPLSASDWAISLGFGAFALAYLAGIALSVRWFLHWLFGG